MSSVTATSELEVPAANRASTASATRLHPRKLHLSASLLLIVALSMVNLVQFVRMYRWYRRQGYRRNVARKKAWWQAGGTP